MNNWFSVDKEGLRKILERRGKQFAIFELIQNAWDTDAKNVEVILEKIPGRPFADLIVKDDHPEGYTDLSHAYTLFAESEKKGDPEKRGWMNLGEKLVLSMCKHAEVRSTKGTIYFHEDGSMSRDADDKTDCGSQFVAEIRMNQKEFDQVVDAFWSLIAPPHCTTTLTHDRNEEGLPIPYRRPVCTFEASLPTQIADHEGLMKRTTRKAQIEVYDLTDADRKEQMRGWIYEMGIPVVATGDRYHVNVCVAPQTRILTSDLRYVQICELNIGDGLVGFEEVKTGHRRKFCPSQVLATSSVYLPSYRLKFEDGTEVICSENHQWLCRRYGGGNTSQWKLTKNLVVPTDGRDGSCVIKPLDVWEDDLSFESGYLAAAFDGEGCFFQRKAHGSDGVINNLEFVQNNNEMLMLVRTYLDRKNLSFREQVIDHQNPKHRPRRLLSKLDINLLGTFPIKNRVRLIEKEFLGRRKLIALETSSRTYIAEGLASHNCQKVPVNMDRDNVPPGYLKKLRALVLNHTASLLTEEESGESWVTNALESEEVEASAVNTTMDKRFGKKRASYDPTDPESSKNLMAKGYTIIHGRTLPGAAWESVRRSGAIQSSGSIAPTPKPYSDDPNAPPVKVIPKEKWNEGMEEIATVAKILARYLIGTDDLAVRYVLPKDRGWAACCDGYNLDFNVSTMGYAYYQNWHDYPERILNTLVHEFAHKKADDHLDEAFHKECTRMAGELAVLLMRKTVPYLTPLLHGDCDVFKQ